MVSRLLFGCSSNANQDASPNISPSTSPNTEPNTSPDASSNTGHAVPSNDEIFAYIQDITQFGPRHTGSESNVNTAEYLAQKFTEFGLHDVAIEQGDTYQWYASRWTLEVQGIAIPAFYIRHSFHPGGEGQFSTGPSGLHAEIVDIGSRQDLSGLDVRGKIVVADVLLRELSLGLLGVVAHTVHDPDESLSGADHLDPFTPNNFPYNYAAAMAAGAVGFIGVLSNYFDSNEYYNEDLSYWIDANYHMSIPGLWVSRGDGAKLRDILSAPATSKGTLVLDGEVKRVKYRNVIGFVPGAAEETIMIQSHHDSAFMGAVEDASGTAEVLALARYYGQRAEPPSQRRKMFVLMDTHFTDYQAHEDFARKHLLAGGDIDVVANVTLEHIARELRVENGVAVPTGLVEPRLIMTSDNLLDLVSEKVVHRDYRRSLVATTKLFRDEWGLLPT